MNGSQNSMLKWSQDVAHTFSQWFSQGTKAKLTRVALFCLISLLWHLCCLWWPKSCVWHRSMNGSGWKGLDMSTIWLGMLLGLPLLEVAGWVVFISTNHFVAVGEICWRWANRTVWCATGYCLVRRHITQPLGFWSSWPLEALSSMAPDSPVPHQTGTVHCPVRLLRLLWLLHELSAHCSVCRCPLQSTVALVAVAPLGAPDSPLNYSGVALEKPKGEEFGLVRSWCTGYCPLAHRTVRCARPEHTWVSFAPFFLNPNFDLLLVCVKPLCTCRIYNLEQTS
jgi:hypothetical protein